MRLDLIANYSRSLEKSYPRKGVLPSGAKAAPFLSPTSSPTPTTGSARQDRGGGGAGLDRLSCCAVGWRRATDDRANTRRCRRGRREGVLIFLRGGNRPAFG